MRRGISLVAAATLAAGAALTSQGPASAGTADVQTVAVQTVNGTVNLSHSMVDPGRVQFVVAGGSSVTMFQPINGATVKQFFHDLSEEFSRDPAIAAQGTRDLNRDAKVYGLADPEPGQTLTVTENLTPGRYFLFDSNITSPAIPPVSVLRVRPGAESASLAPAAAATVLMTSQDRFVAPPALPAQGTIRVRNVADTLHFADLSPVAPGTTDADVQAFFDGTGPPPFIQGPGASMEPLSAGQQAELGYRLPAGDYVLLCFIADDVTGLPHALMGMHLVVHLG
ncbi:MAG: hypothetical protein ACR2KN_01630 [Geodermatophilaceae bacterium]